MNKEPKISRRVKTEKDYWDHKLWRLKGRAKAKGLVFELTLKNVKNLRNGICTYCGFKNKFMTIDRKDNSLGYILKNCVSACFMCNKLKGKELSYEEMTILGKAIKKIRVKNPLIWQFDPNIKRT